MAKQKTIVDRPDPTPDATDQDTVTAGADGANPQSDDAAPAPTQGSEGQAVAAEGADPSARQDSEIAGSLVVTGPQKGRRRAGIDFTAEAQTLLLDDLTDDQVVAITNDPALSVVHLPAV